MSQKNVRAFTINLEEIENINAPMVKDIKNKAEGFKLTAFTPSYGQPKKTKTFFMDIKQIEFLKNEPMLAVSKKIDFIIIILIFSSFMLSYAASSMFMIEGQDKPANSTSVGIDNIRFINCGIVLLTEIFLIGAYFQEMRSLRKKNLLSQKDNIFNVGLLKWLLLEMLIIGIVSPPGLNGNVSGKMLTGVFIYSYDSMVFLLSFAKMYYIVKFVKKYSLFSDSRASLLAESRKRKATLLFAAKSYLKTYPYMILFCVFFGSALMITLILRTVEYSYVPNTKLSEIGIKSMTNPKLKSFIDVFWLTVISMTTVGYGDLYPNTHFGRLIVFASAIIGTFLVSLTISFLSSGIEFDPEQKKAYLNIIKQDSVSEMKESAQASIRLFCNFFMDMSNTPSKEGKGKRIYRIVKTLNLLSFQTKIFDSKFKSVQNFFLPSDKVLSNLKSHTEKQIGFIQAAHNALIEIRDRTKAMSIEEKQISVSVKNISVLYKHLAGLAIDINTHVQQKKGTEMAKLSKSYI